MGIIYFLSIIILFTSILSIKKVDRKINAVGTFLVTIIAYMCYQAILAYFFDLLRIPITPLNVSICNIILSCTISTIHYLKVKDFQKYYIKKQDIIFIIILLAVNLPILYTEFGLLDNFRYISTDSVMHSQAAITFSKSEYLLDYMKNWEAINPTFMITSYVNDGLLMKALVNYVGEFHLYQIYIFTDVSYYLIIGYMFYLLITSSSKCDTKFKHVIAYIISILFMIGYPLNSIITGFHYFTLGILEFITIIYIIKVLFKESNRLIYIILFILNTGIMLTYNLLAPILFVIEFMYMIFDVLKYKEKIITKNNFIKLLVVFIIPGLIGLCFFILPRLTENIVLENQQQLWIDGYIYINYISNIIVFMPLVLYYIFNKLNKKEINIEIITFLIILLFIMLLFIGFIINFVSTYYLMKPFYLLNTIIFIILYKSICMILDKYTKGKIIISISCLIYITLLLLNLIFVNVGPYDFKNKNENISKIYDIYNSNKAISCLITNNFPKDRIDILEYISDNNLIEGQNLLFLGNYIDNFLFKMYFEYENREGIDLKNTEEHIEKWNNGEYKYLVVFMKDMYLKYYKDNLKLDNSNVIFETDNCVIYKK